ncbi:unnamed protein product [Sphagnum balticum]
MPRSGSIWSSKFRQLVRPESPVSFQSEHHEVFVCTSDSGLRASEHRVALDAVCSNMDIFETVARQTLREAARLSPANPTKALFPKSSSEARAARPTMRNATEWNCDWMEVSSSNSDLRPADADIRITIENAVVNYLHYDVPLTWMSWI